MQLLCIEVHDYGVSLKMPPAIQCDLKCYPMRFTQGTVVVASCAGRWRRVSGV